MSAAIVEARFRNQLLGEQRGADVVAVARRLLAVQAQDLRSARLAIRARARRLAASDIDRALADGTVLVGWLNRGTLHLVCREDYWWLHALTTPPLFSANARRLAQTGVTPAAAERGVAAIAQALREEGPRSREQLRERVQAVGVPTEGQALVHVLMLACLGGIAVRGPIVDGRHAYVAADDWVGRRRPVERDVALAELARRYLRGHAPADDRDLAKWAGLPLRDASDGLKALARELRLRDDGLLELGGEIAEEHPRSILLDQWDPILVGWRSRETVLAQYPLVGSPEAHYRRFAYVRGRAVATWSLRRGVAEIGPSFGAHARVEQRALLADAADLTRFLAE